MTYKNNSETSNLEKVELPDKNGMFGEYGGSYVPEQLQKILDEITQSSEKIKNDQTFIAELRDLNKHYAGRPSPIFYCKNLPEKIGGADIYLKREDLNHTGAHKINHCLGEALLAKRMGKEKLIAETLKSPWCLSISKSASIRSMVAFMQSGMYIMGSLVSSLRKHLYFFSSIACLHCFIN